jgi:hypothetical protein
MDIDTPTTDIVITDEAVLVENPTNESFGKEIAKTLIISTATTAGMLVGVAAVGFVVGKFQEFKTKRASKGDVIEGEVIETPTETPTNKK